MSKPTKHYEKWRIRWIDENGTRLSEVFENLKDAQYALRKHEIEVEEIKRGVRLPTIENKTFADLCAHWISKRAPQKRSGIADQSIISCHLLPYFGKSKLQFLGSGNVDEYALSRSHLSPKTVANHLTLLISMLNLAIDLRWLSHVVFFHGSNVFEYGSRNFDLCAHAESIDHARETSQGQLALRPAA